MRPTVVLKTCPYVGQMWVGGTVEVAADEILGYAESHDSICFYDAISSVMDPSFSAPLSSWPQLRITDWLTE